MYYIIISKEIFQMVYNMLHRFQCGKPYDRLFLVCCANLEPRVLIDRLNLLHKCNILTNRMPYDFRGGKAVTVECPRHDESLRYSPLQLLKWLHCIYDNININAVVMDAEENDAHLFLCELIEELTFKIVRMLPGYQTASSCDIPDVPVWEKMDCIES